MTAETEEEQKIEKKYVLKVIDRCDSCNAQALVLVKGVTGELMFCGHHYAKNEAALVEFAYEVIDEREKIVQNRLIGSAN
jgi:hypothetical protein